MTYKTRIILPSVLLVGMFLSGCQKPSEYTSSIQAKTDDEKPIADIASLLPLRSGISWTFETKVDQQTFTDIAVVRGPTRAGGREAILVETKRNGQLVLREAYRLTSGMLTLTAFSTSAKQWVVLDPPFLLVKDSARLGDEYLWNGKLRIEGKSIDAHGLSRASIREAVQTQSAGRFSGVRIDSGIAAPLPNGDQIKYQTTRWLATGIGFIRREYLDRTARRQSNLVSFKIK